MGYYIEVPKNLHKAEQLIELHRAKITEPNWPPPKESILICVVENGPFDAAAICYDEEEFKAFNHRTFHDFRPRTWLLMDKQKVLTLNPNVIRRLK